MEASPAIQTGTRSSLTAILPDGSMSSPVVARLLRRTRELVEEFKVEFATPNRSIKKKSDNSNNKGGNDVRSPCMMLTMNVTCADNGSNGLDLCQDVRTEKCTFIDTNKIARTSSKRQTKVVRSPDGIAKSAVGYERCSFDYMHADRLPSTPLRTKKSKPLLQTPTKDRYSPGFYRASPSLNLTPTKTTPSTPLRPNMSAELLWTPMKSDDSPTRNKSPLWMSPHRRKAKLDRAPPSAQSSSIF